MYTLYRLLSTRGFLLTQLPTLGGSLLIAEMFYKFGSFSLEVVAFLATWFVLDAIYRALMNVFGIGQQLTGHGIMIESPAASEPSAAGSTERRNNSR